MTIFDLFFVMWGLAILAWFVGYATYNLALDNAIAAFKSGTIIQKLDAMMILFPYLTASPKMAIATVTWLRPWSIESLKDLEEVDSPSGNL